MSAFECGGHMIGTIRLIPLGTGLAPCEALLGKGIVAPASMHTAAWEAGRLVLGPNYRAGPDLIRRCLFLTLLHLVRTVEIENLFASCTPLLGRLYRRFGFAVLVSDACRVGDESYSLIHGTVARVLFALADNDAERLLATQALAAGQQELP